MASKVKHVVHDKINDYGEPEEGEKPKDGEEHQQPPPPPPVEGEPAPPAPEQVVVAAPAEEKKGGLAGLFDKFTRRR